jgi:hypothetical protein
MGLFFVGVTRTVVVCVFSFAEVESLGCSWSEVHDRGHGSQKWVVVEYQLVT